MAVSRQKLENMFSNILHFFPQHRRTGRAGNKGFAYTFITAEQGRYAGDIIKAVELSGSTVPEDLLALWETYKEEAKAVSFVFLRTSLAYTP